MKLLKDGEKAKPGGWYFFVVCHNCKSEIIFAEAPTPNESEAPKVRGVKATCPQCKAVDNYRASEVRRGQVDDNS